MAPLMDITPTWTITTLILTAWTTTTMEEEEEESNLLMVGGESGCRVCVGGGCNILSPCVRICMHLAILFMDVQM